MSKLGSIARKLGAAIKITTKAVMISTVTIGMLGILGKKLSKLGEERHCHALGHYNAYWAKDSDPNIFVNKQGLRIHYSCSRPAPGTTVCGIVVICHDFGTHSGRYRHVVDAMTQGGLVVYTMDLQGHGQSEGDRGYVTRFDDYVDDLLCLGKLARESNPGMSSKMFLLGHGMGGLIATQTMRRCASVATPNSPCMFAGCVLASPMFVGARSLTPAMGTFTHYASALLPKLKLDIKLNPDWGLSRNHTAILKHQRDPLVYRGRIKSRVANELERQYKDITYGAMTVQWPFLLMHGTADQCAPIYGSRRFMAASSSLDKEYMVLQNWKHNLFSEPSTGGTHTVNRALEKAVDWIVMRALKTDSEYN